LGDLVRDVVQHLTIGVLNNSLVACTTLKNNGLCGQIPDDSSPVGGGRHYNREFKRGRPNDSSVQPVYWKLGKHRLQHIQQRHFGDRNDAALPCFAELMRSTAALFRQHVALLKTSPTQVLDTVNGNAGAGLPELSVGLVVGLSAFARRTASPRLHAAAPPVQAFAIGEVGAGSSNLLTISVGSTANIVTGPIVPPPLVIFAESDTV
jgi:hypothetical protein